MSTRVELSLGRIVQLFEQFQQENPFADWEQTYADDVNWAQSLAPQSWAGEDVQTRLWKLRGIATIGPGESVDVRRAVRAPDVINALLAVRQTVLPHDDEARAAALQVGYAQAMDAVYPRFSAQRPQAKLARLFTALFPRDTTTLYKADAARIVERLLLGSRQAEAIERMVLIRARLRTALGEERDIAGHVRRSTFCWWLYDNAQEIEQGAQPAPGKPLQPATATAALPTLVLWPVGKQRKGLSAIGGYVETWRSVVAAARNGAKPDEIAETMREAYGLSSLSPKTCRMVFTEVKGAGFLVARDGLWYPTEDGERLLEDDPPDVLVERLLVQYYGLAQVLRFFKPGQRTVAELIQDLRRRHPRWTTDFAPRTQLGWARSLGLVARAESGGGEGLTEYGLAWEARLPSDLPDPQPLQKVESEAPDAEGAVAEEASVAHASQAPSFDIMRAALAERQPGFVQSPQSLRAIHIAWHCHPRKRFLLLSGLSGTGKTALLHHYAQAYVGLGGGIPRDQICLVSVSPDWRDPASLIGYYNALHSDPTWQKEPALTLLLHAQRHPHAPHFLLLDEMNLAQIEHYFAPFLSAMETGDDVRLHQENDEVNGVPATLPWPDNLFIGGTLNLDETTHALSDKVLDRAFTFEFWDVDLPAFFGRQDPPAPEPVATVLLALHDCLRPVRRHFGYRAAGEVLAFCAHGEADAEMLDIAVLAKILPKVRGENSPEFVGAITLAREICAKAGLTRCVAKLDQLHGRLLTLGATQFWT